mgnify:CR=1 FL=1
MNKEKSSAGRIQWGRMLKKLSPYTIQKGFRYLKHYGPKEFWIRLHERFEPEEVPYGPWYEAYVPDEAALEKQRHHHFEYSPLISVAVPAYRTPEKFLAQMIDSLLAQTYGNWELCIANGSPEDGAMKKVLEEYTKKDSRFSAAFFIDLFYAVLICELFKKFVYIFPGSKLYLFTVRIIAIEKCFAIFPKCKRAITVYLKSFFR